MCDVAYFIRLPLINPDQIYLSALVLVPAENLRSTIHAVRQAHPIANAVADQPHVTLLFLGRIKGKHLVQFQIAAYKLCPPHFEMETAGLGTFRNDGRITSLHVCLAVNVRLVAAHHVLLDKAKEFGWFSAGAYAGAFYTPHVSIYDSMDIAAEEADRIIDGWRWDDIQFSLDDAHIRAVPISSDHR